jgi:hypothetical protein
MEARSRATLGIEVYTNPATGERYTVPNTYNHVWINPQGNVVGTETDTSPGSAFEPLQRVPPGG